MTVVGWAVAAVLLGIAALHFYWAAGGAAGRAAAVPERDGRRTVTPSTTGTAVAGCLFALAAVVILGRAGAWEGSAAPGSVIRIATWGIGAIFLLRAIGDFRLVGFFKQARGTRFARLDDLAYSPLSLGIAVAVLWLAAR